MSQGLDGDSAVDSAVLFSVGLERTGLGRGALLSGLLLAHFWCIVGCISVGVRGICMCKISVDMRHVLGEGGPCQKCQGDRKSEGNVAGARQISIRCLGERREEQKKL